MSAPKKRSGAATEWYAFTGRRSREILCGWPGAVPNPRLRFCPRHQVAIGPTTHICLLCHTEGWDEVARMFLDSRKRTSA